MSAHPYTSWFLSIIFEKVRLWRIALIILSPFLMAMQDADKFYADPVPSNSELQAEAFVVAQYASISEAAAAVSRVSARFAAGDDELAQHEQNRDKNLAQLAEIDQEIKVNIFDNSEKAKDRKEKLVSERAAISAELSRLDELIEKNYPQYFELTRPNPLTVKQVQRLLNGDEAFIKMFVDDDATYVWGITQDNVIWHRSDTMSSSKLETKVRFIRSSMGVYKARNGVTQEKADSNLTIDESEIIPFDNVAAFEIYKELLGPLESIIGEKSVLITTVNGPLTSLPLSLLVTEKPSTELSTRGSLKQLDWLIDRFALAEVPSVSSLRALRCLLIPKGKKAHRGCDIVANTNNRKMPDKKQVSLVGVGAPTLFGSPSIARNPVNVGRIYDGELADPDKLRELAWLPGAQNELESLRDAFGSDSHIMMASDATEGAVKRSKLIESARFVVFSTHGLLATEVGNNGEPGLVFTPPKKSERSQFDDGYLTASEAAQLKLTSELVVLSACNTAAGNGEPGAQGLSGLARAFFFAGARSVIVSHWAVSDDATAMLMDRVFRNIDSDDIAGVGKALQEAMLSVREDTNGKFVDPVYWAPFTLVGIPDA